MKIQNSLPSRQVNGLSTPSARPLVSGVSALRSPAAVGLFLAALVASPSVALATTIDVATGVSTVLTTTNGLDAVELIKTGAGTLTFQNTNYTGPDNWYFDARAGALVLDNTSFSLNNTANGPRVAGIGGAVLTLQNGASITKGSLAGNDFRFRVGGGGAGNSGTLNMTSGTISGFGELTLNGFATNGNQTATVNQSGGTVAVSVVFMGDSTATNTATYNLNGGTLRTSSFGGAGSLTTANLNFNGGTLQAAGNVTFGAPGALKFNVKAGGATIDTQAFNTTFNGALLADSTGGGLTKIGTGTLTLTNSGNTYTGGTFVDAGTLATGATGNFGSGAVTVISGGKLTLGNNQSIADSAKLTFASSSLTGSINLDFSGTETVGSVFNSFTSTFLNLNAGQSYSASELNSLFTGNAVFTGKGSLTIASAIPEPSTYAALAGLGILGFAVARRRRSTGTAA
jgi:autotransporter-associated beta strand protein